MAENNILLDRIKNCFLAAGQATGCSAEIEVGSTYYDVANSPRLADAYKGYMKERYQDDIGSMTFPASTGKCNTSAVSIALMITGRFWKCYIRTARFTRRVRDTFEEPLQRW